MATVGERCLNGRELSDVLVGQRIAERLAGLNRQLQVAVDGTSR